MTAQVPHSHFVLLQPATFTATGKPKTWRVTINVEPLMAEYSLKDALAMVKAYIEKGIAA